MISLWSVHGISADHWTSRNFLSMKQQNRPACSNPQISHILADPKAECFKIYKVWIKLFNFNQIQSVTYLLIQINQNWKLKFLKPDYFKKICFLSSFLLTWSKYIGPKWPRNTLQASSMHLEHETSLLRTPWQYWTCIFTSGK